MADNSVDKSVVNWLMHVISGKQPIEMRLNETAEAVPEAVVQEPEAVTAPIAVEELPRTVEPGKVEAQNQASSFTAEDLCGAPVFKEIQPPEDVFTAEDLCGAPVFKETKPQTNGVVDISKAAGPQLVEIPKHEIAPVDISREVAADPREGTGVVDILRDEELQTVESAEQEITPADISRNPETYAAELRASAATVAEVDWLPAGQPEVVPTEPVAQAAMAEEIVSEPALHIVEPEVDAVAAAEESRAVVTEPEIDAADTQEGVATIEEGWLGTSLMPIEPQGGATADSVHAPELNEPETEHAVSESAAGSSFRMTEPDFYREPEPREAVSSTEEAYPESFRREAERLYTDPEILKELEGRPEGMASALKALMHLGSVLPWAARLAPLFEGSMVGEQSLTASPEVRHEVAGLRLVQYEIKTTVQDHSLQLKRLEDQLTRVQESVESDSSDSASVMESVKSTAKLVRLMGIGMGVLLVVLIIMVAMLMAHGR